MKILLAATFTATLPTIAMAGSIVPPIIEEVAILPPAIPGEFYIGGVFSLATGQDSTATSGPFPLEGNMFGVFAGYNVLRNSPWIFGAEAAYQFGDISPNTPLAPPGAGLDYMLDAKARLGYRLGNAMVYGVAGGAFSTYDDGFGAQIPVSGFAYGGGVELKLNPRLFVGVEYLARNLTGSAGIATADLTVNTTQFRVGLSF